MSKIVFFCIPAHGHTNPTLNVVRELINQGHEVLYYSYEPLREKIEATGASFRACDEFDAEQHINPEEAAKVGKDLAISTKLLVDTTLALDKPLCQEMEQFRPDCIVADSMAVWGKAIAMKLKIPFVSSTTTFAFNKDSAKIMKQSMGQMLGMALSMPKINKDIERLKEAGYPVNSVLDLIQNDAHTHTIVYTSPEFQPCSDTFLPEYYSFVGPSIRPAESEFGKRAKKLVYISMGTVNNHMLPFYQNCIAALANERCQVVLSAGIETDIKQLGKLPENFDVYPQVDQIAVLKQADVFLSHCGMNSASESLYFGVPLVMFPQTSEQSGVAARIAQLGAGAFLKRTKPAGILKAIRSVLNNLSYAESAKRIANSFHNCPGAKAAADKILQVTE